MLGPIRDVSSRKYGRYIRLEEVQLLIGRYLFFDTETLRQAVLELPR